ncbi:TPA: M16 family metallopeptidase [Streptococcus agalactiae]
MKIVEGVSLHLIKNQQFKTNHLTFRFSGDFNNKTVARRSLVAQMLVTANAKYPKVQEFREKLASLYGASLSTKISTKGLVHIVDIDIVFVKNTFTLEQYQTSIFDTEKKNLIQYLEADIEDNFYSSDLALKSLFYNNKTLRLPKYGTASLVESENSFTAYQEFQKMLKEDQLDIFVVGDFDDYRMIQAFNRMAFEPRHKVLAFDYTQTYENITRSQVEDKDVNQSIMQLAYHLPITYKDEDYFALIVFNGLFGAFAHSLLFTEIREKQGLAYTIGSQFDSFTGLFTIYAGIDKENRERFLKLINKQFNNIKMGRFSSTLLKQTKDILKMNYVLASDNPKVIVDHIYHEHYLDQFHTSALFIDKVDDVTKSDIVSVATKLKLQAFYFLEGN